VVIRENDTPETLRDKVEVAAILGTFQSMLTDFRYLRSTWKKNVDEERLLGVSLTGIMDNEITSGAKGKDALISLLKDLRCLAVDTNVEWAALLGIPRSAAVTTVKPSGTVSQLTDAASGIHRRFARHYVRTVRNDKLDPLSAFLVEQGIPHETDVSKASNWVFSFPTQSPSHACVVEEETTAIEQLEHYLVYARHWAEHNVSVTIYVREHEWLEVGAWVYQHFNDINGVSFLPYVEHVYKQAPYQAISAEEYMRLAAEFPKVDFSNFKVDEYEDNTQGSHMLACVGNACEIT
jgi:ribonucleoside-diphosphate reductase alpha chain